MLIQTEDGYTLISSGLTSPAPLPDGSLASLRDGVLFVGETPVEIRPLPDTRILTDGTGAMLVLTGPTASYGHGVLGDKTEARGFSIISATGNVLSTMVSGGVIEGTSAIWTDINGDGTHEVLLTLSNAMEGARLEAYDEKGRLVAIGPSIGSGYRWLHQLAVAPFGPDGQMEIATLKTPHLNITAEFFVMKDGTFTLTASKRGYSSHTMGSRNLDMALAGDLDSDGHVELLVPTGGMGSLAGLRRVSGGVVEAWRLKLPGSLLTNIAVTEVNGKAALGVGTSKKILRLWLP